MNELTSNNISHENGTGGVLMCQPQLKCEKKSCIHAPTEMSWFLSAV